MSRKVKNFISLILNLTVVILTYISVTTLFNYGLSGNMDGRGVAGFRFFTVDSNILLALSSLTLVFSIILKKTPKWVMIFKMMAVTCTTLTFIVVCVFLGPVLGYQLMFQDVNLYMHLISPILGVLSFAIFDPKRAITSNQNMISVIPVITYGLVYLNNVVIIKKWDDFYNLNSGFLEGRWYISFILMLLVAFFISRLLYKWYRKK